MKQHIDRQKRTQSKTLDIGANETNNSNYSEQKSEELTKAETYQNTPIKLRYLDGHGWCGTLGYGRITEMFETETQLIEYINSKPWEMILAIITMYVSKAEEIRKEVEKQKETIK